MHTLRLVKTQFHFNGDFSGNVSINSLENNITISVPFEEIVTLVAEYVRRNKIAELEQMSDVKLIGAIS